VIVTRRHAIMGVACLAAAGGALALKPRRRVSLANGKKLDVAIPRQFAGWSERPTDALITPEDKDSLATRLYSQIVGRLYVNQNGAMVMMLVAYGDTQNDLLQLHRPEVCYPSFGFSIARTEKVMIPLAPGADIPGRSLTANSAQRIEQILYWTRIGEHLPTDGREQRVAKLEDQFAGIIPDGVLIRISMISDDAAEGLAVNQRFASDLLHAISPASRAIFIGSKAASAMEAARSSQTQA
jgi:EpsI family protein